MHLIFQEFVRDREKYSKVCDWLKTAFSKISNSLPHAIQQTSLHMPPQQQFSPDWPYGAEDIGTPLWKDIERLERAGIPSFGDSTPIVETRSLPPSAPPQTYESPDIQMQDYQKNIGTADALTSARSIHNLEPGSLTTPMVSGPSPRLSRPLSQSLSVRSPFSRTLLTLAISQVARAYSIRFPAAWARGFYAGSTSLTTWRRGRISVMMFADCFFEDAPDSSLSDRGWRVRLSWS